MDYHAVKKNLLMADTK